MRYTAEQFATDILKELERTRYGHVVLRYAKTPLDYMKESQDRYFAPNLTIIHASYDPARLQITINGSDPDIKGHRLALAYATMHEFAHYLVDSNEDLALMHRLMGLRSHGPEWQEEFKSLGVTNPLIFPPEVNPYSFKPEMLAFINSLPEITEW